MSKKGLITLSFVILIFTSLIFIPMTSRLMPLWITVMVFASICTLLIDHVISGSYPTTAIMLFEDDEFEQDCEDEFCPEL